MRTVLTAVGAAIAGWLLFIAALSVLALAVTRPDPQSIRNAAKLLPNTLRLVRRLASDRAIPLSTRMPVWLLLGYLAFPIDVVPDFIPVLGYADDAIVVAVVLRRFVRRAGASKLAEHWPGDVHGLVQLQRLLQISPP